MNNKFISTFPKQAKAVLPYLQIIYLILKIVIAVNSLSFGYFRISRAH